MADTFSRRQRSQIMAAVHSTSNKATEGKLISIFRDFGIKGWRRHLPLAGKPDFTFSRQRVIVFVDGCFWHGCKRHLRIPSDNREYWHKKISRNLTRDRITARKLKQQGWRVLRIWEHELKYESRVAHKIMKTLSLREQQRHGEAA